ncbi:hypothetical protein GCM10017557_00150 [Streptomyces aurantiacus]|uniref:Uncharacterized protein n=1 Tax=Streptomyces aurantiacus TaxID=47760 RepID=A0A7G1NU98_9ACTN|nr:hypothetical protein GCM10017557_00150 [Streptomyces aurantiacus]
MPGSSSSANQASLCSLQVRRTYSPRGRIPLLRHRLNWKRASMAGTLGHHSTVTLIPTAPLPYNNEWQGLVATVENSLGLHAHKPGSLTGPGPLPPRPHRRHDRLALAPDPRCRRVRPSAVRGSR